MTRVARRWLFAVLGVASLYGVARLWIGSVAESRLEASIGRIRAAGEPVTMAEAVPPLPDAENAAPMIRAASALVAEEPSDAFTPDRDPGTVRPEAHDAVRTWVEQSRPALELLSRGLDERPRCRFGAKDPIADLSFEEIPGLQQLSRLVKAHAMLSSLQGDLGAALSDVRLLDRFGDRIADSPLLIHRLVGMGVQQVAPRVLEAALGRGRPAEGALRALERHFASLPPRRLDRTLILAERAYGILLFDRMHDLDANRQRVLGESAEGSSLLCGLFPSPALTLDQVRWIDLWTRALPLAGRPWSETGAAWSDLESDAARDAPWYARYSGGLVPTLAIVSVKSSATEARRELARLALRLELHEATVGTLPARLADLGPEPIPADPVSGLPFAYRVTDGGGGYLLYGLGRNRRDDGGAEESEEGAPPGADDVAFRRRAR